MKLTQLAIEGNTLTHDVRLGRFATGLNFIYGENGAGKTALRNFVRGMLSDFSHDLSESTSKWFGSVGFVAADQPYRFVRDHASPQNARLEIVTSHNGVTTSIDGGRSAIDTLFNMDRRLVDAVYHFGFRNSVNDRVLLAEVLHNQLQVPIGPDAAADHVGAHSRQRQIDELQSALGSLQSAIDRRKRERTELNQRIDTAGANHRSQLTEINVNIDRVTARLSELSSTSLRSQLADIEQQIAALRLQMEEASRPIAVQPAPVATTPDIVLLYQRLDDLDHQIQRWRHVQSDVQKQRVRLKDEMLEWNQMTLESDEHPYHNAREILVGLEARVDQTEQTARRWSAAVASQMDVAQMTQTLQEICHHMREDLYSLCHELSHQYKHIRQKAAAVELKQLRRCYNEMGESTKRLVQRRDHLVDEIRSLDPVGADAIERAEHKFCQCANHEGYLTARRRYLGDVPYSVATSPVQTYVSPELPGLQQRLAALENQRNDLLSTISGLESDRMELERQHAQWLSQRDRLTLSADIAAWTDQIRQIDADLERLEREYSTTLARLHAIEGQAVAAPNPILSHAGRVLDQLTQGEYSQVFLIRDSHQTDLQVRDRHGRVHNFTGIDHASQNHVYLSLALAACDSLAADGQRRPMLIDDAFAHIGPDKVNQTLATLDDFCKRNDQQIFVLTQHRYLADRLPGLPVFELPPTAPAATPVHVPQRTPSAPRAAPVTQPVHRPVNLPQPENLIASGVVFNETPKTLAGSWPQAVSIDADRFRPYPLSKYAPEAGAVLVTDEHEQEYQLPWSPLNRSPASETHARLTESTELQHLRLFDTDRLNLLAGAGLTTIEHLLLLDASRLPAALHDAGITERQIDRWQSQAWLLLTIPALTAFDARVLVACGITEPEHLDTSHAQQLLERVERFLHSADGQRFLRDRRDRRVLTLDDIGRWHRSLDSTRSRWQGGRRNWQPRSGRRSRTGQPQRSRPTDSLRDFDRNRQDRSRTYSVADYPHRQRMHSGDFNERSHRDREDRRERESRPAAMAPRTERESNRSGHDEDTSNKALKFYLDLSDHIEAAPSIGPKTAERFEKIGVRTIADFLKQTAESISQRLKYKRITVDLVRQWQHQARLVCRIPNLRGHDAQLLVACGYTEPEAIAAMQPQKLYSIVGPFSETKEGLKIIRSGKKPDLAEVTDWIDWSEHTRSLQAA